MRLATKIILLAALALAFLAAVARFISGLLAEPKAFPGYTLVAPLLSTRTHLVDMQGRAVRTWESQYTAGQARVPDRKWPPAAGRPASRGGATLCRPPGRRPGSGIHVGRRARLGLQIPQRETDSPPRPCQAAQRQRALDRVGGQDGSRNDCRRTEPGIRRRPLARSTRRSRSSPRERQPARSYGSGTSGTI